MRKSVFGAALVAAAILVSADAKAADIARPVYKAPVVVPMYNWSGFYIGGNVGWGRTDANVSNLTDTGYFFPANAASFNAANSYKFKDHAFTGGGQIGLNWQAGIWVLGVEGDWSALNTTSSSTLILPYVTVPANGTRIDNTFDTDWLATIRGRMGVAGGPQGRGLFYVTGGAALAKVGLSNATTELTPLGAGANCAAFHCGTSSVSDTKLGWTVGGGVEWSVGGNWTVKAEYLYADFGNIDSTTSHNGPNAPATASLIANKADFNIQIARAGINYKF